jgi:hypothetical protein
MNGPVRLADANRATGKRKALGVTAAAFIAAAALPLSSANAGGTVNFGDGQSITVGLGVRTDFTSQSDGAPNGSRSADFTLDSVRLYVNATLNEYIKATFNTERDGNGNIDVLDGYAQFEFADGFNVWVGRMLPPSDRANLDGPYYLNNWLYPGVVSQYPAKFAGRDDGVTVWGKLLDKKLVYSVGAFEGHNRITGASDQGDNLLYAGRIVYNFLDAEPDPAYYESSTYYGSVDILTLGFAAQYQADGVGTALRHGDYTAWNFDLLFEKKLPVGVVTLEGAYYHYDTGGVTDVSPSFGGAGPTANVGGISQGEGYMIGGAYLIPGQVGWGQFQPFVRYQDYDNSLNHTSSSEYDFGVNYVIKGHNARISLDYSKNDGGGIASYDRFIAGLQLQF